MTLQDWDFSWHPCSIHRELKAFWKAAAARLQSQPQAAPGTTGGLSMPWVSLLRIPTDWDLGRFSNGLHGTFWILLSKKVGVGIQAWGRLWSQVCNFKFSAHTSLLCEQECWDHIIVRWCWLMFRICESVTAIIPDWKESFLIIIMATCQLEVKTLKGKTVLLDDIALDTSIEALYRRVHDVETTPDGKWKLMIITSSLRTLKWGEKERVLSEFGVQAEGSYRVEVVLDMGACHGGLCRKWWLEDCDGYSSWLVKSLVVTTWCAKFSVAESFWKSCLVLPVPL